MLLFGFRRCKCSSGVIKLPGKTNVQPPCLNVCLMFKNVGGTRFDAGVRNMFTGRKFMPRTTSHLRSAGIGRRRESVVESVQPRARAAASHQRAGVVQQLIEPLHIVRLVAANEDRAAVILRT